MKCTDVIAFIGLYLDSELESTTTFQIQAHLAHCARCRLRYAQEHELERRISASLQQSEGGNDDQRWTKIVHRALPQQRGLDPVRASFRIRFGSAHSQWISLVASLVFLAALASAGLGLRHSGRMPLPSWHHALQLQTGGIQIGCCSPRQFPAPGRCSHGLRYS
jgi:anti-sigma factor RsiW